MSDNVSSAALGSEPMSRVRRPWSRKLNPAQIKALINAYHGGSNVRDIMAEFRIGRTSLYRYIHDYDSMPDVENDVSYWRIEAQRLKELVVEMAKETKRLNDLLAERALNAV